MNLADLAEYPQPTDFAIRGTDDVWRCATEEEARRIKAALSSPPVEAVDRVARAILASYYPEIVCTWDSANEELRNIFRAGARAALEAMR